MKKFLIFTFLTVFSFGCSKEQVTLHEELNISQGESLKSYLENSVNLFAKAQYNISKQNAVEKSKTINLLRRIQETNTIDEDAMLSLSKLYGFANSREFTSYAENLQKIQTLMLEEFPEMKNKNQQELSRFVEDYIEKENMTFFHLSPAGAVERRAPGYDLDDLTCVNDLKFRYDPNTPLSDFVCPNEANFTGCWNTWKSCVNTQAVSSLSAINGCISNASGAFTLTFAVGAAIPGVGAPIGIFFGIVNGTAAFIFCAEDVVELFENNACVTCQSAFDTCCVIM